MSTTTKTRSPKNIANEAKNVEQMLANESKLSGLGATRAVSERPSKTLRRIARAGLEKNPDTRRANDTPPRRKTK